MAAWTVLLLWLALPAALQSAKAPKHGADDLVVFERFPSDPAMFRSDLRSFIPGIIQRHGMEEWRIAVLTSEIHRHLGIYSVIGAKMGLRAREYFGADLDELEVRSRAGLRPPVSCLNDGLQVSTGATIGHGTISVSSGGKAIPEAEFTHGGRTILIHLKPDVLTSMRTDLAAAIREHGDLTPAYFDRVRELSVRCWLELDRKDIFEIRESGK